MFLTSISKLIPSLWISWLLLCIFGSSIYFISNPCPIISKRRRRPRTNWKRPKIRRSRKLNYWLVRCCRLQPNNRPPHLDGYFFPSLCCAKHHRWVRGGGACTKTFSNCRHIDKILSGCKDVYHP